jgi:hydrogenase expression/formation protein HypC
VVHLGHAISRMSEEEAAAAWEIYDAILAAQDGDRVEV